MPVTLDATPPPEAVGDPRAMLKWLREWEQSLADALSSSAEKHTPGGVPHNQQDHAGKRGPSPAPPPATRKRLTRIQAAENGLKFMKENGVRVVMKVKLPADVEERVMTNILEGYGRALEVLPPQVVRNVTRVEIDSVSWDETIAVTDHGLSWQHAGGREGANTDVTLGVNAAKFTASHIKDLHKRQWTTSRTPAEVIVHEMGHVLDGEISTRIIRRGEAGDYGMNGDSSPRITQYGEALTRSLGPGALSHYGEEAGGAEEFAEAVTVIVTRPPSEWNGRTELIADRIETDLGTPLRPLGPRPERPPTPLESALAEAQAEVAAERAVIVVRHLPGQHNQQDHAGKRGGAPGGWAGMFNGTEEERQVFHRALAQAQAIVPGDWHKGLKGVTFMPNPAGPQELTAGAGRVLAQTLSRTRGGELEAYITIYNDSTSQAFMEDGAKRRVVITSTPEELVLHELGHVVEGHTSLVMNGRATTTQPDLLSQIYKFNRGPQVSQYARSSSHEAFAENFVVLARDGTVGKQAETVRRTTTILHRELGEAVYNMNTGRWQTTSEVNTNGVELMEDL